MCLAGHSITADELRNFLALFKMSSPAVVSFPRGWGSGVELDQGGGGGRGLQGMYLQYRNPAFR